MTASKPTPPSPTARDRTETPHIQHVREHLRRLGGGMASVSDPEAVYLGHQDVDHFWELVGLRLSGHPSVILGAGRFQRHDYPGAENPRESLSAYLSSPPSPVGSSYGAGRAGQLSLYLPRWHETVPVFLARLRAGPDHAPVHLDPGLVQVAFDFRMGNPAGLETAKRRAGPMSSFLFRTTAGHVLRGNSHGPGSRGNSHGPGSRGGFVGITGCEQLTAAGRRILGAVMLNESFIALAVPLDDEKTRLAAPNWVPFLPATANKRHLLY